MSRDSERLKALEDADFALYKLWKKCCIDEPLMVEVNNLQTTFIHPEIRKLQTKPAPKSNEPLGIKDTRSKVGEK